jgi:O-antigen/teichoic acid export membrane protein
MHPALRQTAVYFVTIAASQGLSFLLLPVVTAYLSPRTYGDYTLALSLSGLVATVGSSWIRNVSFRLFHDPATAGGTRGFFVTVAACQAAVVLALFVPTALAVGWTGYVPLPVMLAACASALAGDFYAHAVTLLRAEQRSGHYALAEIGSAAVRFAATLAGLAVGIRSPVLLFLAPALAAALLAAHATRVLWRRLPGRAGLDRALVRALVRHGPGSVPFSIAGWAEKLADRLVLDHFLARAVVGVYTANYAIAERILGGVASALFLMAWPDILRAWRDGGKEEAREAVSRSLRLYLWLASGPAVFIAVFHRELALLLGPAYREGSGIMPFVVGATWLAGLNGYLNRHLELTLRFATLSGIAVAGAALNLALNLLLVPRLGLEGAALASLLNHAATGVLFWCIRDRELVRVPVETVVEVALLLAAGLAASRLAAGPWERPAVFVAVYGAGAAWFVARRFRRRQPAWEGRAA